MAKLAGRIQFKLRDKDGNLVLNREQPSRSFVLQFVELLYVYHGQINRDMDDVDGTTRTVEYESHGGVQSRKPNLAVCAGPGVTPWYPCIGAGNWDTFGKCSMHSVDIRGRDFGIVVGNGATGVTPQDTALGQKLDHGRGTNQLEYGGSEVLEPEFSDPNGEMLLRRYFTNRSGATITVRECGIYAVGATFYGGVYPCQGLQSGKAWSFCIARDLVTPNIDVLNNQILEVTYKTQTTA